jgi:hypothetical protein
LATDRGNIATVELLLKHGADRTLKVSTLSANYNDLLLVTCPTKKNSNNKKYCRTRMDIRQRISRRSPSALTSSPCLSAHEYGVGCKSSRCATECISRAPFCAGSYRRATFSAETSFPPSHRILCPPHKGEGFTDGDEVISASLDVVEVAPRDFG